MSPHPKLLLLAVPTLILCGLLCTQSFAEPTSPKTLLSPGPAPGFGPESRPSAEARKKYEAGDAPSPAVGWDGQPTPFPSPEGKSEPEPAEPPPFVGPVSVQIGSFQTIRKAALVRSIVKNLGTARVQSVQTERQERLYRVLVGEFQDMASAKQFIEKYNLKKLFPEVWVSPILVTDAIAQETLTEGEIDPYILNLDLYCWDHKQGQFKGEFRPEPGLSGGAVEYNVNWSCDTTPPERLAEKDKNRRPTHFRISPFFGSNSMSATPTSGTATAITGFTYGAELGFFRNFGGVGPFLDYRIARHSYGLLASSPPPNLAYEHRLTAGATLHIRDRFEVEPVAGILREHFISGTSFVYQFVPFIGMKARIGVFRLNEHSEVDLGFGYHELLAGTTGGITTKQGSMWSAEIKTRQFTERAIGLSWFIEVFGIAQDSSLGTQTATNVLLGGSLYFR